ncbi:hypothetical protein BC828DRAFT_379728 [Blastocladiella britannica]|nr:hypothetical protein BC828DRAFT_379728 [Blastocladiella britannica]
MGNVWLALTCQHCVPQIHMCKLVDDGGYEDHVVMALELVAKVGIHKPCSERLECVWDVVGHDLPLDQHIVHIPAVIPFAHNVNVQCGGIVLAHGPPWVARWRLDLQRQLELGFLALHALEMVHEPPQARAALGVLQRYCLSCHGKFTRCRSDGSVVIRAVVAALASAAIARVLALRHGAVWRNLSRLVGVRGNGGNEVGGVHNVNVVVLL